MNLRAWLAVGTIVLGLSPLTAQTPLPTSEKELGAVILVRDAFGTPHVFATTDEGAYFGAGWAAAEDRFFQMSWFRLSIQGRIAQYFGPGANNIHVEHDKKMRVFGYQRHAEQVIQQIDAETRDLLQAYADGVNAWMNSSSVSFHPFFAQYRVPIEAWTAADCIAAWHRVGRFFAPDGLGKAKGLHDFEALVRQFGRDRAIQMMTPNPVYDEPAAVVQQSDVPPAVQQAIFNYAQQMGYNNTYNGPYEHESPKFSHAWVVGGGKSTTGSALLHSDPQSPIHVPSTFMEMYIHGASFSARGIQTPGSPNFVIGFNKRVAWGATALGMDQSDLYRLTVDPQNHPGEYFLDGAWRPWDYVLTETIEVQGGQPVVLTVEGTHWGPVVTEVVPDARPGEEYALKAIPMADTDRDSATAFIAIYRAKNILEFGRALEDWRFPSANVLFGDADGGIGYWAQGASPLRSLDSPLGGRIAQTGNDTRFDWLDIIPHDLMPWVMDPADGHILSGNHAPVGSWYPLPIGAGTGSVGDTSRSRRLRERLEALTNFAPNDVLDVHHDTVNVSRRDFVFLGQYLRDRQAWPLSADALSALNELIPWMQAGAEMTGAHPATALASFLNTQFRANNAGVLTDTYGAGDNGLQLFLKTKVADVTAQPPIPLNSDEADYLDQVLSEAWRAANNAAGPPAAWQTWYEQNRLTRSLPRWQSLDGFASLDPGNPVRVGPLTCVDGGTILSQAAQAYSHNVVTGTPNIGVSILPLGQQESDRGFQVNQQGLYESESFKPAPVTLRGLRGMGKVIVTRIR